MSGEAPKHAFRPGPPLKPGGTTRETPPFVEYPCEDYFRDGWAERGFEEWLEFPDHCLHITRLIERAAGVEEESPGEGYRPPEPLLRVGGPGIDGVGWVYRRGDPGLWTFTPMELRTECLTPAAATVSELMRRWTNGDSA